MLPHPLGSVHTFPEKIIHSPISAYESLPVVHRTVSARNLMSPFTFFKLVEHDIISVSDLAAKYALEAFVFRSETVISYLPQAFGSNLFYREVYILSDYYFLFRRISYASLYS